MSVTTKSKQSRRMSEEFQQLLRHVPNDHVEIWGPVVAYQYDSGGSRPIQKYLTALIHEAAGKWMLVRQINNIENGYEWTSRPIVSEISELAARHWLQENKFSSK